MHRQLANSVKLRERLYGYGLCRLGVSSWELNKNNWISSRRSDVLMIGGRSALCLRKTVLF